ncbi:MAG: nucleotidyl transferase AbiEii/AbiGii toxin family protein [Candidatus Methylomirabilales bacterium]
MSASGRDRTESIRHRLRNRIRERGEDVQFALQRYAQERFLYRLGESPSRERFILKGAMLFALWGGPVYRPTRDLDLTGHGSSDAEEVLAALRQICEMPCATDGLLFDPATLTAEPIRDEEEYHGLRIRLQATLGESRIPMQIDIGFGNAIEPPAVDVQYPTLLNDLPPRIRAYPQEAVIAEKLHAMVLLGERTSRFKDFYDLYVLARQFPFEGPRLARAIAATFERRRTTIDAVQPAALAPRFFADPTRAAQWRTYLDRNRLPGAPADFDAVGEVLRTFLGPPWNTLADDQVFEPSWQPGGPWGRIKIGGQIVPPSFPAAPGEDLDRIAVGSGGGPLSDVMGEREGMGLRRFKPYPEYKDSGVEWLGEIPTHWRFLPLKRVTDFTTGWTPPTGERQFYEGDHFWANISDLGPRVLYETQKTISDEAVRQSGMKPSPPGALLFAFKLSVGTVSITGASMYTNEAIATFLPGAAIDVTFLYWAAPVYVPQNAIENIYGAQLLNRERIANAWLCVPPADEQRAIAALLDRETARIDALVAKKERLIELLQEKRTAIITQAATKGLDPNVPMKDSGVEWLGEIPAHWEVKRIRDIADSLQTGPFGSQLHADEYVPGGSPVINPANLQDGQLVPDWDCTVDVATARRLKRHRLTADDILLARRGELGRCGLATLQHEGWLCGTGSFRLRTQRDLARPRFLLHLLSTSGVRDWLQLQSVSSTMQNLNTAIIGRIPVALPVPAEQDEIVARIDWEAGRIDALVARVRDAIERLKEFRAALISAAVTGKIDVRGGAEE